MSVTRRMSKRMLNEGPNSISKSLRTDLSSCADTIRSPYFLQASEQKTDTKNDRETQPSTEEDGTKQNQTSQLKPIETLQSYSVGSGESESSSVSNVSRTKLGQDFYEQECITLAKALLGQIVVRVVDGVRISGRIVETESYLGGPDVASHSHNGKRTPRTEPMYMKPGTSYVYSIYGMYYCFNISSKGEGSCVLIRSLEPLEGLEEMQIGRRGRRKDQVTLLKPHQLCNGPSKLCQSLYLTKDCNNKVDLTESDDFWLESGSPVPKSKIVVCKRIGVDACGQEWANKPLRFYEYNSKFVSVRDRTAEGQMALE